MAIATPRDKNPALALRSAVRELMLCNGALDEHRRPCGANLPMAHAHALLELSSVESMSVGQLASRLSIDRTSVSRLCQRMEEEKEVTRQADPQDRRSTLVRLTDVGRERANAVHAQSAHRFEKLVAALGDRTELVIESLVELAGAMSQAKEDI